MEILPDYSGFSQVAIHVRDRVDAELAEPSTPVTSAPLWSSCILFLSAFGSVDWWWWGTVGSLSRIDVQVLVYETEALLLCRPGWLRTHRNPLASASKVLGLKVCNTKPGPIISFHYYYIFRSLELIISNLKNVVWLPPLSNLRLRMEPSLLTKHIFGTGCKL